jgi:transcriptional regulator with XRE-family HTH domain
MPRRRKEYQKKTELSPESQRLLLVLKQAMKVLGFINRDVEAKLGLSGSYLSRLFAGIIELRVAHVVDIARVIGLEPEEIFQIAFPRKDKPSSVAAAHVWEALGAKTPAPPEKPPEDQGVAPELERVMEKLMARSLEKMLGRIGS